MVRVAFLTTDSREHLKDYTSPTPYFGTAPEALLEGFKLLPAEIEVHVVSCLQEKPLSSPDQLADNIYYHALHVPKAGWMRTGYQGCIRATRQLLKTIKPDIVHGQGTERDCAIAAVFSGFPNVLTIHGNMESIAKEIHAKPLSYYWFAARLEKWCLSRTNGVVAISAYTESKIAHRARRSWLLPNAVNPVFFGIKRNEAKVPRLLCIAHVSPWKNQVGLIEALELLRREFVFELVFAGNANPNDTYAAQFLRSVEKHFWCIHLGVLQRSELMKELSSASAVVLPSFEDNCPMVLLEAAAASVPTAAAEVGGIPDLVQHGKTGLLFAPHDHKSIVSAIRTILTNPVAAATMAKTARVLCQQRNSAEFIADRHLDVYRQVMKDAFRIKTARE